MVKFNYFIGRSILQRVYEVTVRAGDLLLLSNKNVIIELVKRSLPYL